MSARPIGVLYYVKGHVGPVQRTAFASQKNAVMRVSGYFYDEACDRVEIINRDTGAVLDTGIREGRTVTWWLGTSRPAAHIKAMKVAGQRLSQMIH